MFFSSQYLYEKYGQDEKAYNFAVGSITADYKADIVPFIQDIAKNLNEVFGKKLNGEKIIFGDLFALKTTSNYPLFTFETNQAGDQTGKFSVSCRSKNIKDKQFLFNDLAETQVIAKEDSYKSLFAIELELKAYFDDERLTKGIFAIFHRGIRCGTRTDLVDSYSKNNDAWKGFDFSEEKQDLPF